MKKLLGVMAALLASLLVLSLTNNPAVADDVDRNGKSHGVWCYTPVLDALTPFPFGTNNDYKGDEYEGEKIFLTTFENAEWTGVIEGASRDYGVLIADPPLSPTAFAATVVFDSARVKGVEGGLVLDVNGGILGDEWFGRFTVSSGTGALASIEGRGTWWGPGFNVEKPDECGVIYYKFDKLRGVNARKPRPLKVKLEIATTEADFECKQGIPTGQAGEGHLSYLGRVEASGGHCTNLETLQITDGFGTYTTTSGNSIDITDSGDATPTDDGFIGKGSAEIVGGTGRYDAASGQFDFTVTTPVLPDGSFGTAKLEGRGWIAYDPSNRRSS